MPNLLRSFKILVKGTYLLLTAFQSLWEYNQCYSKGDSVNLAGKHIHSSTPAGERKRCHVHRHLCANHISSYDLWLAVVQFSFFFHSFVEILMRHSWPCRSRDADELRFIRNSYWIFVAFYAQIFHLQLKCNHFIYSQTITENLSQTKIKSPKSWKSPQLKAEH